MLKMYMSVALTGVLLGVFSSAASALAMSPTFNFNGFIVPDDDSGIMPDVSATFSWDDSCNSGCTLQLDLTYNDSNSGAGLTSTAHVFAGVTWDTSSAIIVDAALSTVLAPTLVGSQSGTALTDLPGPTTIGSVTGAEVTPHWAFRDDLFFDALDGLDAVPIEWDALGDYVFSSVGDVTFAGITSDQTGIDHLLPGFPSSVENPTNGAPFAVVDPFTTSVVGTNGDVVFAQTTTSAFFNYDGTLSGIENVTPLFGTDGVAVPEPSTALLLVQGLVLLAFTRRSRGHR